MKIEEKKFVALSYTLMVDGEVADQASAEHPLTFVFGSGYLLPEFEKNLEGKQKGEKFEFTLTPANGYGEINPQMIVELPHDSFRIDGHIEEGLLTIGNQIPMQTSDGANLLGIITEVGENTVKMDFNHPMAGKTLDFSGEIIEVRDAREEDYPHFGAHGGCGCGCESDESGCNCEDCHQ